ncbi:MAG: MFS transporter [Promethearchaeota archaeon]
MKEKLRVSLSRLEFEYKIMKFLCFFMWSANVIFMIFGVIFIHELGISVSGIFLFNIIVIAISFSMSTFLNRLSDKIKKRKEFLMLAYLLRCAGIVLLAFSYNIYFIFAYYILISLLNPISFEVAIIYELGEQIEELKIKLGINEKSQNSSTYYYLKYRIFGSLGWAVAAPVAGFFINMLNNIGGTIAGQGTSLIGYKIFMGIAATIYLISLFIFKAVFKDVSDWKKVITNISNSNKNNDGNDAFKDYLKIKEDDNKQANGNRKPVQENDVKKLNLKNDSTPPRVSKLSFNFAFILLLISMFLFQSGFTLFQAPYGIFLKDFSRGNLFLVGTSYFCSAIPEVPLFMLAFKVINKKGYQFTLSMSFILELTRIFLTILIIPINVASIIVPLQIMNSFSLRWPSITHGISQELTPRNRASGMNLEIIIEKAGGFFGNFLGTLISASMPESTGAFMILFMLSLVLISINTIIYISGAIWLNIKKRKEKNKLKGIDDEKIKKLLDRDF